jgi:hypothetical protein
VRSRGRRSGGLACPWSARCCSPAS